MNIEINYYYPNENINNKVEFKIENLLKSLGFELKELYSSDINCGIYRKFEFEKEEGICKECGIKLLPIIDFKDICASCMFKKCYVL